MPMTTILVVEDEPAILELLELNLVDAGYAVDEADNGRDAIRLVEQGGGTADEEARKTAYDAAIKRATEQAYWCPLHTYVSTFGFQKQLEFPTFPDELPRFYLAKWK